MVGYGVVWYGIVRCGNGMSWFRIAWYYKIWYAWYTMVWYSMIWHDEVLYGMEWFGIVKYTKWYNKAYHTWPQFSTIHFGLVNFGHSLTKHFRITLGLNRTGHFTTGSITVTFSPFLSIVCLHMRSRTCSPSPHVLEQACHSWGTQLWRITIFLFHVM